ncbi:5-demethoxyubiquinone hydroxylase, mitochondrial [Caerostris extrusa]|uniref:5-demethoxyubiquinone hydroxylase, mitochondrial n=1 Tax=Caerostris extrusa TaxID=172846 RepID=A0AAV4W764_CAEEX|nr:5-demethoxyubiquinone hydroxylase, mitochondrial [Caerostris extrusa]
MTAVPLTTFCVLRRGLATKAFQETSSYKRRDLQDRILRVDHAGEFGADRIYAGQMAVLGTSNVGSVIKEMWEQEKEHLQKFEELYPKDIEPLVVYAYAILGSCRLCSWSTKEKKEIVY